LSLINAGLAQSKGRSGWPWWGVSLFLGPIATLLIVACPAIHHNARYVNQDKVENHTGLEMANIVIDKSFLDGAPTLQVRNLCNDHVVLFSQTLLHEVMTTSIKSQKRCFSKLPERDNPVALIENVQSLKLYEIENGTACTPLAERVVDVDFSFNTELRKGTYVPIGAAKQVLDDWEKQVEKDTNNFINRCNCVNQFFPELFEKNNLSAAIEYARKKTAEDHDFIRAIYKSFLDEIDSVNAPSPESLSPKWAHFRWVQCQILSALRMYLKYQGNVPSPPSPKVLTKAEHTMHDIYYTILGTLSGALATTDLEIIDDFLLACPEGKLITYK